MKQAALKTKQTTRVMPVTMDQMDNPSTWLHLNVDPHARGCIPRDMRCSDGLEETMENIVLRADPASTYVIARPPEQMPSERRGLCIQLERFRKTLDPRWEVTERETHTCLEDAGTDGHPATKIA